MAFSSRFVGTRNMRYGLHVQGSPMDDRLYQVPLECLLFGINVGDSYMNIITVIQHKENLKDFWDGKPCIKGSGGHLMCCIFSRFSFPCSDVTLLQKASYLLNFCDNKNKECFVIVLYYSNGSECHDLKIPWVVIFRFNVHSMFEECFVRICMLRIYFYYRLK